MNKYISKLKVSMIFATTLVVVSCSESFLEPKPQSFYTPENSLNTPEGLQAVVDNIFSKLRSEYTGNDAPLLTTMQYTDAAIYGNTDRVSFVVDMNKQMLPNTQLNHPNFTRTAWFWDDSYKIIKDCNTVINRIDDATYSSEGERNALLGSAMFLRAFRYYEKTMLYGDVPLILEEPLEAKSDYTTTTKESIWKKMIKDLEFAVASVPEANNVAIGRVTKAACKQLLTKYYLLNGRFDDAIRLTSEIIDGGVHKLCVDRFGIDALIPEKDVIWDLHRIENKSLPSNTEGLLVTVSRFQVEGAASSISTMRNGSPYWGKKIKTPAGETGTTDAPGYEFGQVEKYGRGVGTSRGTYYSTHEMWSHNGEMDVTDYRHCISNGNWMTMEGLVYNTPALEGKSEWFGKNLQLYSDEGVILCSDTIHSWFQWPYYKTYAPDEGARQPWGGPGDYYIYRLAETYLLRAEAYTWKNQWQKAADDINIIRKRANSEYMYTAADLQKDQIGAVLDERNRELYFEELRQVELTRIAHIYAKTGISCYNGKTYTEAQLVNDNFYYDRVVEKSNFYNKDVETRIGMKFTISPFHIFWPVPQVSIDVNIGAVINQNIGYPGAEKNVEPLVYEE